ncbi:hypothetical protein [Mucilaginibacter sp. OK283]|jgi:hypothetical protein|uniref:hypothetical protein n=1 Tax=Mucilaginibacter sp. OK283 TaxID=1881049 RepID=UPI0008B62EC2|nr:hypothetical protein [Mucilaginibacter sp. OK283]SEP40581.1 hypothetical protein SAMN05428947_114176 [Mucilaginibacter sp. OK283]
MKKLSQILFALLFVAIDSYTYAQPADSIKVQRSVIDFTRLHVEHSRQFKPKKMF